MHAPIKRGRRLQRVDALTDLILDDPRIARDAKILNFLKVAVRGTMGRPRDPQVAANQPTLYRRYRGNRFPVTEPNGTRLPSWRTLTPWMKVQLAALVLNERGYLVFKAHPYDDLRVELLAAGKDLRDELRNDLMRHLKRRFGSAPWFFFVMEDRTTAGDPTRPHVHGSIELRPIKLDPSDKRVPLRLRRLAQREGLAAAELQAGKELVATLPDRMNAARLKLKLHRAGCSTSTREGFPARAWARSPESSDRTA